MTVRRGHEATLGFLQAFKEFALKGNVVDLAVAVVIGAAFGKIIASLVEDIIMPSVVNPLVNLTTQGGDWRELTVGPGIKIGSFLGTVLDFAIVAFALFVVVTLIQRLTQRKKAEEVAAAPSERECPYCLSTIPAAASRCPHCTSELTPQGPVP